MASLHRDRDEVVVTLTTLEKAEALRGDVRVPALASFDQLLIGCADPEAVQRQLVIG